MRTIIILVFLMMPTFTALSGMKNKTYLDISKITKMSDCLIYLSGNMETVSKYKKHLNQQIRYNSVRNDIVNLLMKGELQAGDWIYLYVNAHNKGKNLKQLHGIEHYKKTVKITCKSINY